MLGQNVQEDDVFWIKRWVEIMVVSKVLFNKEPTMIKSKAGMDLRVR